MLELKRYFRALLPAFLAFVMLSACGGSHGGTSSILPTTADGGPRNTQATGGDVVAINAGGSAAGAFSADTDYVAGGTWTYTSTSVVDTSKIATPAPAAVYADARQGSKIAYTIPGLTAGAAYTVRLSFAELWFAAAGQRSFNITINNTKVASNFDIFATAGAKNRAVLESFDVTASASGTIAIVLDAVTNYALINAVEVATSGTGPTPPPGTNVSIDSGGSATGNFLADTDYVAKGTWTFATTSAIATAGITNPAPQAVYQTQRTGPTVNYTIPGLTAGATYTVRLDFAELYWTAANQRVFNVTINNARVLSNFDIVKTAGGRFKAVAQSFSATANSSGAIAISLTAVTDNPVINGIEITSGSGTVPPVTFNDYTTFGYDNQRDVFNPNSTAITPASIAKLHLAWQARLGGGDYNTQSQPVLATNISGHAAVLFADGGSGKVYAYDGLTGARIWTTFIGQESYTQCGGGTSVFGMGGTVAYDANSKSLYVVGNTNPAPNAYAANTLYHLDGATGNVLGQANFAPSGANAAEMNFSHTAVTLRNGIAYVGTGSTCDISSWRGRVAAINVPSMTLAKIFFTVWDPNNTRGAGAQPWGGGGIWGWGGVSLDFNGNVLTGVGNADDGTTPQGAITSPFVKAPHEYSGYGDTLLELSSDLNSVVASHHPIPLNTFSRLANDLDVQGTPLVFQPNGAGCGTMVALQGKSGELTLYNENRLSNGPAAQYQLAPSTADDGYLGDPAYSPVTNLVYAPVASSTSPTLFAAGLIAINPGCGNPSVAWHTAFGSDSTPNGIPRSVPAASAGGVVIAGTVNGTGGDIWAIDAATGAVLNGGAAFLHTSANVRMPATIDGNWIFVLDKSGNLYGLTIDPKYATVQAQAFAPDARSLQHWQSTRK